MTDHVLRRKPSAALNVPAITMATLVIAGCATGGSPFGNNGSVDRTFVIAAQTWDLNKDGTVTCDEWKQYVAQLLNETDTNRDGALDATEFAAMSQTDRLFQIANFAYFDTNSDGRVATEELMNKQNPAFKLLDKNTDCVIDRTESVQSYNVDKAKEKEVDQNIAKPK